MRCAACNRLVQKHLTAGSGGHGPVTWRRPTTGPVGPSRCEPCLDRIAAQVDAIARLHVLNILADLTLEAVSA